MIGDGPFKSAIESGGHIIKEEYTRLTIEDGVIVKRTATRRYFNDGDYVDATHEEPLAKGERLESSIDKLQSAGAGLDHRSR